MTTPLALAASVIAVVALALPPGAEAQAQRRGGSDSGSGSSSSAGSSRGGSDGGGAVAVPRHPSPAPPPVTRERPSQPAGVSGGPARTSGSRLAPVPESRVEPSARGASSAAMRVRSAQAVRGVAQPRANVITPNPPRSYDPWYRWSPWYGYGYGYSYGYPYHYGHVGYSPWGYGGAWSWSRYRWHDPFLFDPYGYAGVPYYWGPSSQTSDDWDVRDQGVPTGSVRLRVSPGHARVYIDGALAGVASEFSGLSGHLTLPVGTHELELRADGYGTHTSQIEVRDGRTRTERVNLKRQ